MIDRGQFISNKISRLDVSLQKDASELILRLLTDLNIHADDNGKIVFSISQIALFNRIWERWLKEVRTLSIKNINEDLYEVHDLVVDAYREDGYNMKPSKKVLEFIASLGFGTLAAGTFADLILKAGDVKNRILQKFIYAMGIGDSAKSLKQYFAESIPKEFTKFHKGFLYDVHSQVERIVSKKYADDLGLTHATYAGTVIETTRDFCEERVYKAFTIDEIQSWNDLEWRGKIPGVDVLVALGGYNCRHYLNYISEERYNQKKQEE